MTMWVSQSSVYPVYSLFICLAGVASLGLSQLVTFRTALITGGVLVPVHLLALLWVCLPKVRCTNPQPPRPVVQSGECHVMWCMLVCGVVVAAGVSQGRCGCDRGTNVAVPQGP